MHSKNKGNLGVLSVAKLLSLSQINVFVEIGDLSKIDIIAEKEGKLLKIQVKSVESEDGVIRFRTIKTGPNKYYYKYQESDFDYFAIYCRDLDKVYFMKSSEALKRNVQVTLRITEAKGKNENAILYAKEYEGIDKLLF